LLTLALKDATFPSFPRYMWKKGKTLTPIERHMSLLSSNSTFRNTQSGFSAASLHSFGYSARHAPHHRA
jgi:hypothetical protein